MSPSMLIAELRSRGIEPLIRDSRLSCAVPPQQSPRI
jgi:hypothetical protein